MSIIEGARAGFYVDGFNLYHAIDDLGKPYLKWLSLRRLANRIARQFKTEVAEIVFCTALFKSDFAKLKRHETYIAALKAEGVVVRMGHITQEPMSCRSCSRQWDQPREKETDINVALSLYTALSRDIVDVAFLITADTDQAATLKFVAEFCPGKRIIVLTPPGRHESTHLKNGAFKSIKLSETDLDLSVFPAMIKPDQGRLITRPPQYEPPEGWLHPDSRRK